MTQIFEGLTFALNSHSNFETNESELVNLVEKNGATFSRNVTQEVTHLLCSHYNDSFRIQTAEKHSIYLVNEHFVLDSIKHGMKQQESKYRVLPENKQNVQKKPVSPKKATVMQSDDDDDFLREKIVKDEGNDTEEDENLSANKLNPKGEKMVVSLVLKYTKPLQRVELKNGSTFLGRGDLCHIQDKKCSRQQAEIIVDQENKTVHLAARGMNPMNLHLKGHQEPTEMIKDKLYKLNTGDTFTLLVNDYMVAVDIAFNNLQDSDDDTEYRAVKKIKLDTSEEAGKDGKDGDYTLVFPSISTSTFQFDAKKAAKVASHVITQFLNLNKDPRIRLILIDKTDSQVLQTFKQAFTINDKRFSFAVGDITKTKSSGIPAKFIVNTTNEFFNPQGHGINKAINAAAGPQLYNITKSKYKKAKVGKAYLIELPPQSPLHQNEGVQYVIHVLGPNMNPDRANCLKGNYEEGNKLLEECYSNLLRVFYTTATGKNPVMPPPAFANKVSTKAEASQDNKFDEVMKDIDEDITQNKPNQKVSAFNILMNNAKKSGFEQKKPEKLTEAGKGFWKNLLDDYVLKPESHPNEVYDHDDKVVVIYDKYPKAKIHMLVMPAQIVRGFSALNKNSVPMVKDMIKKGNELVKLFKTTHPQLEFKVGFHAVPSLSQLHLHVISQDFQSDALKNKKHWNSFTTEFFIPAEKFLEMLENEGAVKFDKEKYEALLQQPLKCNKCNQQPANINKLKDHLKIHLPKEDSE